MNYNISRTTDNKHYTYLVHQIESVLRFIRKFDNESDYSKRQIEKFLIERAKSCSEKGIQELENIVRIAQEQNFIELQV